MNRRLEYRAKAFELLSLAERSRAAGRHAAVWPDVDESFEADAGFAERLRAASLAGSREGRLNPDRQDGSPSYFYLFEPVVRIGLVVEGLDFPISAFAVERLRLLEGPIGLEPQGADAELSRKRFQAFEDAPADAELTRIGAD